jgi:pimeloyl-ACP methyl ester carboxylesterase
VHWDQRGAGRTFGKNGPEASGPMTFEQFVSDGLEVAEFVRKQFGGGDIFILGHSWGSAVGVHMIKQRPDLFSAFVGTGQIVNYQRNDEANYGRELALARRSGNKTALAELLHIGPPPYDDLGRIGVLRKWADELSDGTGDAPQPRFTSCPDNMSADDIQWMTAGFAFSLASLFGDICAIDLPALGPDFSIPMFFFMGTHDQQTPITLAEEYFEYVKVPKKAFVRFEGCHHFVDMNRPDDFLEHLVTHLESVRRLTD